jgi:peptide/nickel transport system permease protein
VARLLRSELLDLERAEFVKFARAKGVSQRKIVWVHMLRNAMSPAVTLLGFSFGIVVATAVTTEVVFSWPGIGQLAYQAVLWRDFPLLQFIVLIFAATIIFGNLVADAVHVLLDPRIRA